MHWNDLKPNNEEQLARLHAEIRDARDFTLFEVMADPASMHAKVAEGLQVEIPNLIVHRMRKNDLIPTDVLAELVREGPIAGVLFYGFEWWSTGDSGAEVTPFFANLNMQRATLMRIVRCPLILLLSSSLLPAYRREAPDFASIAEGRFTLSLSNESLLDLSVIEMRSSVLEEVAIEDLRRHRAVLEERLALLARVGSSDRRDEMVTHITLGDVAYRLGDLNAAERSFETALAITRSMRSGDEPWALRDESISLDKVGDVLRSKGQAEEALSIYRKVLEIRRRIRSRVGDTPQALRDESLSLERIGDMLRSQGQAGEALSAYREGLDIRRRIRSLVGDAPEAMRDESLSLGEVGDALLLEKQIGEALAIYWEGLEIARYVHAMVGDTPQALRDESVFLGRVGDALRFQGQIGEALSAYREELEIRHRIRSLTGDTPQALRDEFIIYWKFASIVADEKQAREFRDQGLALARQGQHDYPQVPEFAQMVRDMEAVDISHNG